MQNMNTINNYLQKFMNKLFSSNSKVQNDIKDNLFGPVISDRGLSLITSDNLHIFYYSDKMVKEIEGVDNISSDIVQKITIRKNTDFHEFGYEFLIYNLYQDSEPELCNGIRQTKIIKDNEFVLDFTGKGYSSNGVPLNGLCGNLKYRNLLFQYSKGRMGNNFLSKYKNFFADKGNIFIPYKENIEDLLRITIPFVTSHRCADSIYWEKIRYLIITYYKSKGYWNSRDQELISEIEWNSIGKFSGKIIPNEILSTLERTCDNLFHSIYYTKRRQDASNALQLTNTLLLCQRAYYYIFYTLLDCPL